MTSVEIIKLIKEEILENLSLDISQTWEDNAFIQLKYKDEVIAEYSVKLHLGKVE